MIGVPDRKDDSPEEFKRQQDAIAKQVQEAKDKAIQAELDKIIEEGK